MNVGGDAADQMVREGIQMTESAVKLAGLGAKNLAALLLALLREHQKVKGKTSIDRLLHDEKPLSIFHLKRKDIGEFTRLSREYGVLFHPIFNKHSPNSLCDIMVKSEDASKVNRILEQMQYPVPGRETAEKNVHSRAPHEARSTERGSGLMDQIKDIFRSEQPAREPDRAQRLESLGPEILAALVLHVAKENMRGPNPSTLSRLMDKGPENLQAIQVKGIDAPALQSQAEALGIPIHLQETAKGEYTMTAPSAEAPMINRLFERQGHPPPMQEQHPEKAPKKQRESVVGKMEKAKAQTGKALAEPQPQSRPTKAQEPVSVMEKVEQVKTGGAPPTQRGRNPKEKEPQSVIKSMEQVKEIASRATAAAGNKPKAKEAPAPVR